MPDESITQKMKHYLTANQAKSVIYKMKKRYRIYRASQTVGQVLHQKFGYPKPSFVISGITPDSVERLGFECNGSPCLLTIMNGSRVVNQFIFGHVLSYRDDHMVADFMNVRHLSLAQMQMKLDQIHQINRCFLPNARLTVRDHQIVIAQRLSPETFAKTVIHLLEDQIALQEGYVTLDDGHRYHF